MQTPLEAEHPKTINVVSEEMTRGSPEAGNYDIASVTVRSSQRKSEVHIP